MHEACLREEFRLFRPSHHLRVQRRGVLVSFSFTRDIATNQLHSIAVHATRVTRTTIDKQLILARHSPCPHQPRSRLVVGLLVATLGRWFWEGPRRYWNGEALSSHAVRGCRRRLRCACWHARRVTGGGRACLGCSSCRSTARRH